MLKVTITVVKTFLPIAVKSFAFSVLGTMYLFAKLIMGLKIIIHFRPNIISNDRVDLYACSIFSYLYIYNLFFLPVEINFPNYSSAFRFRKHPGYIYPRTFRNRPQSPPETQDSQLTFTWP